MFPCGSKPVHNFLQMKLSHWVDTVYSGDVDSDLEHLEIQQASLGNHVLYNFQGTEQEKDF